MLVGILPIGFFAVNQVNSLNETERVMTQMYQEQLKTLVFSVNQYADDLVQTYWIGKLNEIDRWKKGWEEEYLMERRSLVPHQAEWEKLFRYLDAGGNQ